MLSIVLVLPTLLGGIVALLRYRRRSRVAAPPRIASLESTSAPECGSLGTQVSIANLPLELVSSVADWLERRDLASFVRASRHTRNGVQCKLDSMAETITLITNFKDSIDRFEKLVENQAVVRTVRTINIFLFNMPFDLKDRYYVGGTCKLFNKATANEDAVGRCRKYDESSCPNRLGGNRRSTRLDETSRAGAIYIPERARA